MEKKHICVETAALMDEYRTLLELTDMLPLTVTGHSMVPFLVERRDTVYLSRIRGSLRRGDMALYRRAGGAYVLHRVYRARDGCYTMLGDAQTLPEPGIRQEQLVAVVTAVERKGKQLRKGCFWWFFFEKVWIRMLPLRPLGVRAYGWLHRRIGGRK